MRTYKNFNTTTCGPTLDFCSLNSEAAYEVQFYPFGSETASRASSPPVLIALFDNCTFYVVGKQHPLELLNQKPLFYESELKLGH